MVELHKSLKLTFFLTMWYNLICSWTSHFPIVYVITSILMVIISHSVIGICLCWNTCTFSLLCQMTVNRLYHYDVRHHRLSSKSLIQIRWINTAAMLYVNNGTNIYTKLVLRSTCASFHNLCILCSKKKIGLVIPLNSCSTM